MTGGQVKVEVKYGVLPVYHKTLDLCDLLKQSGINCPIPKGPGTNSTTQSIPDIPSVSVCIDLYDYHTDCTVFYSKKLMCKV